MATSGGDGAEVGIYVVTSLGTGHLLPCIELCNLIASRNYVTTLVLPSILLPSLPPSFHLNPLLRTAEISTFHVGPPTPETEQAQYQSGLDLKTHLESHQPLCAVVDFQVSWTKPIFCEVNVPVVGFFTFGACAAAMEWGAWKSGAGDLNPGEICSIPGLPAEVSIKYHDINRGRRPDGPPGKGGGGRVPGKRPPWVPAIEGSMALMFNTCDDLERPFLDYLADQIGLTVWGVGPLLPEQYWKSPAGSLILDRSIRQPKRGTSCTENEVIQWLDSKPRQSVIYVSFGSEVGPTMEEYPELAAALEESTHPFIWVIQPGSGLPKSSGPGPNEGYFPRDLASRVGDRGLIIKGWAPQLLILSHPSTGGFLSHCGWNSTVEAIGRGIPILAWPIRGDQIYNAKLLAEHLKIGYIVLTDDTSNGVNKNDILNGLAKLMGDREIHERAEVIRAKFDSGFPASSQVGLGGFSDFIDERAARRLQTSHPQEGLESVQGQSPACEHNELK